MSLLYVFFYQLHILFLFNDPLVSFWGAWNMLTSTLPQSEIRITILNTGFLSNLSVSFNNRYNTIKTKIFWAVLLFLPK